MEPSWSLHRALLEPEHAGVCWRMQTYAEVCWRMLTYAGICRRMQRAAEMHAGSLAGSCQYHQPQSSRYADVCWRMLTTYADVCWRMLTYADVCWRMLTYAGPCGACQYHQPQSSGHADVCRRMLAYAIYVGCEVVAKAKGIETLVHLLETSSSRTALLRYERLY
jgi:hypothetical protein